MRPARTTCGVTSRTCASCTKGGSKGSLAVPKLDDAWAELLRRLCAGVIHMNQWNNCPATRYLITPCCSWRKKLLSAKSCGPILPKRLSIRSALRATQDFLREEQL